MRLWGEERGDTLRRHGEGKKQKRIYLGKIWTPGEKRGRKVTGLIFCLDPNPRFADPIPGGEV